MIVLWIDSFYYQSFFNIIGLQMRLFMIKRKLKGKVNYERNR